MAAAVWESDFMPHRQLSKRKHYPTEEMKYSWTTMGVFIIPPYSPLAGDSNNTKLRDRQINIDIIYIFSFSFMIKLTAVMVHYHVK